MTSRTHALLCLLSLSAACLPRAMTAAAITRPLRWGPLVEPSLPYRQVEWESEGAHLRGWLFLPKDAPRGLVVYLHGKDNNRQHGAALAERLVPRGFALLAYDQRGHGRSTGAHCTYGYLETKDLRRGIDTVGIEPVFLLGHSLGGGVALQAAPEDARVRGVVALAPFAELATIVRESTPFFISDRQQREAIAQAEREAGFKVSDVSPVNAATQITVPVFLVHGLQDSFMNVSHSRRIFAALPATLDKRLLTVDGAGHEDIVRQPRVLDEVTAWLEIHAASSPL